MKFLNLLAHAHDVRAGGGRERDADLAGGAYEAAALRGRDRGARRGARGHEEEVVVRGEHVARRGRVLDGVRLVVVQVRGLVDVAVRMGGIEQQPDIYLGTLQSSVCVYVCVCVCTVHM